MVVEERSQKFKFNLLYYPACLKSEPHLTKIQIHSHIDLTAKHLEKHLQELYETEDQFKFYVISDNVCMRQIADYNEIYNKKTSLISAYRFDPKEYDI